MANFISDIVRLAAKTAGADEFAAGDANDAGNLTRKDQEVPVPPLGDPTYLQEDREKQIPDPSGVHAQEDAAEDERPPMKTANSAAIDRILARMFAAEKSAAPFGNGYGFPGQAGPGNVMPFGAQMGMPGSRGQVMPWHGMGMPIPGMGPAMYGQGMQPPMTPENIEAMRTQELLSLQNSGQFNSVAQYDNAVNDVMAKYNRQKAFQQATREQYGHLLTPPKGTQTYMPGMRPGFGQGLGGNGMPNQMGGGFGLHGGYPSMPPAMAQQMGMNPMMNMGGQQQTPAYETGLPEGVSNDIYNNGIRNTPGAIPPQGLGNISPPVSAGGPIQPTTGQQMPQQQQPQQPGLAQQPAPIPLQGGQGRQGGIPHDDLRLAMIEQQLAHAQEQAQQRLMSENTEMAAMGEDPVIQHQQKLENAWKNLQQMSGKLVRDRDTLGGEQYKDPRTGQQLQFAPDSMFMLRSDQYANRPEWQQFQTQWDEYNRLAQEKPQAMMAERKRQMQQQVKQDPRVSMIQKRYNMMLGIPDEAPVEQPAAQQPQQKPNWLQRMGNQFAGQPPAANPPAQQAQQPAGANPPAGQPQQPAPQQPQQVQSQPPPKPQPLRPNEIGQAKGASVNSPFIDSMLEKVANIGKTIGKALASGGRGAVYGGMAGIPLGIMAAPQDYALEGGARGGEQGILAGVAGGMGGVGAGAISKRLGYSKPMQGAHGAMGGLGGALAALIAHQAKSERAPWETQKRLPMSERIMMSMRRKPVDANETTSNTFRQMATLPRAMPSGMLGGFPAQISYKSGSAHSDFIDGIIEKAASMEKEAIPWWLIGTTAAGLLGSYMLGGSSQPQQQQPQEPEGETTSQRMIREAQQRHAQMQQQPRQQSSNFTGHPFGYIPTASGGGGQLSSRPYPFGQSGGQQPTFSGTFRGTDPTRPSVNHPYVKPTSSSYTNFPGVRTTGQN